MANPIPPQFLRSNGVSRKKGHQNADGNDRNTSDGVTGPAFVKAQDRQAEASDGRSRSQKIDDAVNRRDSSKVPAFLKKRGTDDSSSKAANRKALQKRLANLKKGD